MKLEEYRNLKVEQDNQRVYHFLNGYGVSIKRPDADSPNFWEMAVLSSDKGNWSVDYSNEITQQQGSSNGIIYGNSKKEPEKIENILLSVCNL